MTFLIERRRYRPGQFFNSQPRALWKPCGRIHASDITEAHQTAQRVTGAHADDVRVSGLATRRVE